jgi:hypothetical protein
MKNFLLILFSSSLIFFAACDMTNKPAKGLEDEIYIVADSLEYEELRVALESTFEKVIYTPQPEKLFTLKRVSPGELEKYQTKKNIVIVAPMNSNSVASQFIKAIVDTAVQSKILSNQMSQVMKYNLWAKNQLVVVLTAPDMQELEFNILKKSDDLLYAFQKISDERLSQSLYSASYEKKEIEGKLLKEHGWVIYVQADFSLAMNKPEDNFVWLRRSPNSEMERWIFVHWLDRVTPEYLNADSIRTIRNKITQKYYQTSDNQSYVIIGAEYLTTNEVNFNGRYALLTQGLWELNTKGMGGPFINYTFFDEKTKRLYMVDGSIYAPKYYKRNLIQQVDVILQSFMTESELTADRKEDLLDSVKE